MPDGGKEPIPQFAARIKAKYPEYKDVEDTLLTQKIVAKYPEYADMVEMPVGVKKKESGGLTSQSTSTDGSTTPASGDLKPLDVTPEQRKFAEDQTKTPFHTDGKDVSIDEDPIKNVTKPWKEKAVIAKNDLVKFGSAGRNVSESTGQAGLNITKPNSAPQAHIDAAKALNTYNDVTSQVINTVFPNGKTAENYLKNTLIKNGGKLPEDNETVNVAYDKAAKYEYLKDKILKTGNLREAAVQIQRENDSNLDKQISVMEQEKGLKAGSANFQMADLYENIIPQVMQGRFIDQLINDPDIKAMADENPQIKSQYDALKGGQLYVKMPEYGEMVARNILSREYEKRKSNLFANPIFDKSKYLDKLSDELFADNPGLKHIADTRLKGNWEGKIDTNAIADEFSTGAKHTYEQMGNTVADVIGFGKTEGERIESEQEKQFGNVSSGVTGWKKNLGTASNFAGMMLAMGSVNPTARGLGMSSTAANATIAADTFYDSELNNWTLKYPGEPFKAHLGAILSTAAYSASLKSFNSSKIANAIVPELRQTINNTVEDLARLNEKDVTKAATSGLVDKFKNTIKGTGESTAHMVAINSLQSGLDQVLGLKGEDYNKYHPDNEIVDVAKNMIIGSAFPQFLMVHGDSKEVANSLFSIGENPERYTDVANHTALNDSAFREQLDKKLSDINFLAETKKQLDAEGVSKPNQGRALLEAMKEKYNKEKIANIPESAVTRKVEKEIDQSQQVQDKILNGEDVVGDEVKAGLSPQENSVIDAIKEKVDLAKEPDGSMGKTIYDAVQDPNNHKQVIKELVDQSIDPEALEMNVGKKVTAAVLELPQKSEQKTTQELSVSNKITNEDFNKLKDETGAINLKTVASRLGKDLSDGDKVEFFAEKKRFGTWDKDRGLIVDDEGKPWGLTGILNDKDGYVQKITNETIPQTTETSPESNEPPQAEQPGEATLSIEGDRIPEKESKNLDFAIPDNKGISDIGTKEEYYQYLKEKFPESIVNGKIFFHRGNEKISKFDKAKLREGEAAFYFKDNLKSEGYGKNVTSAILDIRKPSDRWPDEGVPKGTDATIASVYKHEHEIDETLKSQGKTIEDLTEYGVYSPAQIHILGSKEDLEAFKKWKQKNEGEQIPVKDNDIREKRFNEWSNGKEINDEKGKPKVFYHGSYKDFNKFKIGDEKNINAGKGFIFFSDTPAYSDLYAKVDPMTEKFPDWAANVKPVFIKTENPFDVRRPEHKKLVEEYNRHQIEEGEKYNNVHIVYKENGRLVRGSTPENTYVNWVNIPRFMDYLKSKGYDFDAILNIDEPEIKNATTIAVTKPENVLSAISYKSFGGEQTPPEPPVETKPVAEGEEDKEATSIKNEFTRQQRENLGLRNEIPAAEKEFGKTWDEAKEKIANGTDPQDLVNELKKKARPLTDVENALLLHHQNTKEIQLNDTNEQINKAAESGNEGDLAEAKIRKARLLDELQDIYDVNKAVGTENARGLASRKMMTDRQYSLTNMLAEKRATANDGKPLTEDQQKEVEALHQKITETQQAFDDYVKEAQEEIGKLQEKILGKPVKDKKSAAQKIRDLADKIEKSKFGKADLPGGTETQGASFDLNKAIADGMRLIADGLEKGKELLDLIKESVENFKKDNPGEDYAKYRQSLNKSLIDASITVDKKTIKEDYSGIVHDKEAFKLRAANQRAKNEADISLKKDEQKKRTTSQKVQDTFIKWQRAFKLSNPLTLGKLSMAALTRMTTDPLEQVVGGAYSSLFPKLSEGSSEGGGLNIKVQAKAMSEGFTQGMKDAADIMKKKSQGKSDLDVVFGKGGQLPPEAIEFFGSLHSAIKAPVKRFAFERSLQKRIARNIKANVDVHDPMVQTQMAMGAYKDALRAIFMQDNAVATGWQRMVHYFETVDPKTGKAPAKAVATSMQWLLPFVKVPTNIASEIGTNVYGVPVGTSKLIHATFTKGVENLSPDEKDVILRNLKKGSLGLAAVALGYMNPQVFGGYYQEKEKRGPNEAKPNSVKLFGVNIPAWLVESPIFQAMEIGATVRRVKDTVVHGNPKGLSEGIWADALGLAEHVPMIGQGIRINKLFSSAEDRKYYVGELAKSTLIPAALDYIAKATDPADEGSIAGKALNPENKRKPGTILEHVESAIPGLRENVPLKHSYTPEQESKPSFKFFIDKGMSLPYASPESIEIKDFKAGMKKKLSDYPKDVVDNYYNIHAKILDQELRDLHGHAYVDRVGDIHLSGGNGKRRINLNDLTKEQLAEVLNEATRSATEKTKQKLFKQK